MLSALEIVGVVVAFVGAILLAVVLQKYIGGVEDTMSEMRENERASSPPTPVKPVRLVDPRRRRR